MSLLSEKETISMHIFHEKRKKKRSQKKDGTYVHDLERATHEKSACINTHTNSLHTVLSEGKDGAGGRQSGAGNRSSGGGAAYGSSGGGTTAIGRTRWRELRLGLRHGGADGRAHGRRFIVVHGVVGDGPIGALKGSDGGVCDGRQDARLGVGVVRRGVAGGRGVGGHRGGPRQDDDDEEQDDAAGHGSHGACTVRAVRESLR